MMVQAPEEVGKIPTDTQDTPILNQPSTSQPQRKHKPRRKQRKETEVSQDEPPTEEHIPTPSHNPLPSGEEYNLNGDEVFVDVTTGENVEQDATVVEKEVSTANDEVVTTAEDVEVYAATLQISKDDETLAQTLMEIKAAKPKTKRVMIQEPSEVRITSPSQPSQLPQAKDKAQMKAKMEEEERIAREKDEANIAVIEEWDDVQAIIDANKQDSGGKFKENSNKKLKRCLEIVPEDDDDDVTIEATSLSSKSPTIVDYKIYKEGKKIYFKIIRKLIDSEGKHQVYWRIVGFKRLHEVTAAQLVLLVYKITTVFNKVNAAMFKSYNCLTLLLQLVEVDRCRKQGQACSCSRDHFLPLDAKRKMVIQMIQKELENDHLEGVEGNVYSFDLASLTRRSEQTHSTTRNTNNESKFLKVKCDFDIAKDKGDGEGSIQTTNKTNTFVELKNKHVANFLVDIEKTIKSNSLESKAKVRCNSSMVVVFGREYENSKVKGETDVFVLTDFWFRQFWWSQGFKPQTGLSNPIDLFNDYRSPRKAINGS
nr:hypothetical protein [Tanacetum cinerariifolium]